MGTIKRVWGVNGDIYPPEKFSHQVEKLPVSVYLIGQSMFGTISKRWRTSSNSLIRSMDWKEV